MAGRAEVTVLGVGNLLLKDDGIGVHLISRLKEESWPEGVELVDGGTAGIDLSPIIESARRLIVVDAVQGGCEPGAIYRLTPEVLRETRDRALSLHQVGFLEAMEIAFWRLGSSPPTVIFGVEPEVIDWGLELSEPVSRSLPRVMELVRQEVRAQLEGEEAPGT